MSGLLFRIKRKEVIIPLLLGLGSILFYIPFLLKGFICCDIQWIANAKIALNNPLHYFSRSMYGYFRPLTMAFFSVLYSLFGLNPFIFSLISKSVHTLNVILLYYVCRKLDLSILVSSIASFFFAFYVVNSSAVFYISTLHDLLSLTCILLFLLFLIKFYSTQDMRSGALLIVFAIAATLFKEMGLMTIGLYILVPLVLKRKINTSRNYIIIGVILVSFSVVYLGLYFITRTYADKQLISNFSVLKNLLYSVVFTISPVTERIVAFLPKSLIPVLHILKILFTIALIPSILYLYRFGPGSIRIMLIWPFLFLLPISMFDWHIGLFSLYPDSTMTRYMYVAIPGVGVVIGWVIERLMTKHRSIFSYKSLIVLGFLFIAINFFAAQRVFGLYYYKSNFVNSLVKQFNKIEMYYPNLSKITISTPNLDETEQEIGDSEIASYLYWLYCHRLIEFQVIEGRQQRAYYDSSGTLHLIWNIQKQKLDLPNKE